MRKSDKKLDNQIRKALTALCENNLKSYQGFKWVTHTVNYSNFPASLKVTCVFANNQELKHFLASEGATQVSSSIAKALSHLAIKLPPPHQYISFDSEQNC